MIDFLNSTAVSLVEMLKLMGIQNSIFMLVVLLVLISAKNIPARFRYLIASIGLLKAVMPVFVPAPFLQKTIIQSFAVQMKGIVLTDMQPVVSEPALSLTGGMLLGWFAIFIIILVYPFTQSLYWRFKLANAEYVDDFSWIGRSIPVYKSTFHSVPFTLGVLNPKIYIPQNWQSWPQTSRDFALKHEMAHIVRNDNFAKIIQHIICSLLFFHPFVWVLAKKIGEYREMACDDFATDGKKHISLEYARALVTIAEDLMPAALPSASASALIKQKHELYNRINYQMENAMKSKNTKRSVWLVAVLLLLIVPLSWTEPAPKVEEPPPPPPNVGKVMGQVVDAKSGEALPGVNVFVKGTSLGAATDKEGNYFILNVPPGIYQIQYSFMGYKSVIQEATVALHKTTEINTKLGVGVIQGEAVSVVSETPPPNTVGKIYGKVTDSKTGEALPGVNVYVLDTNFGAATDREGNYYIVNVPPGNYRLEFRFMGYSTLQLLAQVQALQSTLVNISLTAGPPPVPKGPDKDGVFLAYDQAPEAIGGYAAILENLIYPVIARKAGVEGKVILLTTIDEKGDVVNNEVVKSLGNNGCDEAAIAAVKKTKWKPALADGKPVKVKISIPVVFKLDENNEKVEPVSQTTEGETPIFFAYDKAPEAIGGYGAIQRNLIYPEIARKAGVEGKVIILAVIDEDGEVIKTGVVKSLGNNGCDEAAIAAIEKTQWKPAEQRGKPVKVQISIPVVFKLSDDEEKQSKPEFGLNMETTQYVLTLQSKKPELSTVKEPVVMFVEKTETGIHSSTLKPSGKLSAKEKRMVSEVREIMQNMGIDALMEKNMLKEVYVLASSK